MQPNEVIAITGAAGFIGSYLTGYLNQLGYAQLVLVDDFSSPAKQPNLSGKHYLHHVHREEFFDWYQAHKGQIGYMFHLGARTDTTEMDYEVHRKWNLEYSKAIWALCASGHIPLVYASSAATYGDGAHGYSDSHQLPGILSPLNPYGVSKNEFDKWALAQQAAPPFWAGLKFFNVFGPNEYHKGRMASVIFHAFNQLRQTGTVKLFRSHHPAYPDGGQIRDFVYVKDIAKLCVWLMTQQPASGLYNAGTGHARTFNDLVSSLATAMQVPAHIDYIDTPLDIRDKYQYFTEADMTKIRAAGYSEPFYSLEDAVKEYASQYLARGARF